ncbi:MAG: hypothetical protein HYX68_28710 [Planctomycetes bacterium]|nr:hypothetical protein [Planctomycetota bacterium]
MDKTSIFRWDTIRDLEPDVLPYAVPVPGIKIEIELTSGNRIEAFRADDGQFFFCHGLSFGGIDAPGGPVSPYSGKDVSTILNDFYTRVEPEATAVAGDVVVWYDLNGGPIHSATLINPIATTRGDRLDYASVLCSKSGKRPQANMTLESLVEGPASYGESYVVFRCR